MTTITRNLARFIALPIVSAGIIGGAALGLAGTASATTPPSTNNTANFHAPTTHARPAPTVKAGVQAHRARHLGH
jgi:hypothetical protein